MNTLTHYITTRPDFAEAFLGIHKHSFTEPEKKSAAKSQSIYTNTYRTKINIKNPNRDVDSAEGAYHRCRYLLPTGQKSDKEPWAERDDYCMPEILFHSSTVAVKSLRQQTAG